MRPGVGFIGHVTRKPVSSPVLHNPFAAITQLVEFLPSKQDVIGSIPISRSITVQ
jgi:hypothetical protein